MEKIKHERRKKNQNKLPSITSFQSNLKRLQEEGVQQLHKQKLKNWSFQHISYYMNELLINDIVVVVVVEYLIV